MRVEETVHVEAGRRRVWRLVADPARYRRLFGGTSWQPLEGGKGAVGSTYEVHTEVGAAQLGNTIEIVERTEGYDLAWVSVRGLDQRGRWRLRDNPEGGTDVTLRVYYEAPGGFLGIPGFLADLASAPLVRGRVRDWLATIKTEAEDR